MNAISTLDPEILKNLGPLVHLAGTWEGDKGKDRAPSDDRGVENNVFRERLIFTPFGPTRNHEQTLYGLRYLTTAWELGKEAPFHEELGYWLWDAKAKQVMRCFMVPRGVVVLAGGTAKSDAKQFSMKAKLGDKTYGICSNKFLDKEFRTVAYTLKIKILGSDSFSYEEDTQIKMRGTSKIFHHKDSNTVCRVIHGL